MNAPTTARAGYSESAASPPRYTPIEIADPDDKNPLRRSARRVRVLARYSVVEALHRRNAVEITEEMVTAARRLTGDVEAAGSGFAMTADYGGSAGKASVWAGKPCDRAVDAIGRVRSAERALAGVDDVIACVVVGNWTVRRWAERRGCSETVAKGFLMAALSLLVAHYEGRE